MFRSIRSLISVPTISNITTGITTTNITAVNQSNVGAVISEGGPVTFVQSNTNVTTNATSNIVR